MIQLFIWRDYTTYSTDMTKYEIVAHITTNTSWSLMRLAPSAMEQTTKMWMSIWCMSLSRKTQCVMAFPNKCTNVIFVPMTWRVLCAFVCVRDGWVGGMVWNGMLQKIEWSIHYSCQVYTLAIICIRTTRKWMIIKTIINVAFLQMIWRYCGRCSDRYQHIVSIQFSTSESLVGYDMILNVRSLMTQSGTLQNLLNHHYA